MNLQLHNQNNRPVSATLRKDAVEKPLTGAAFSIMEHYKNLSLENIVEVIDGVTYIEEWKEIIGYEGLYQISNFGRVKSLSRKVKHSHYHFSDKPERILKQKMSSHYLHVGLSNNKVVTHFLIHRLVGAHFISNTECKLEVNHKSGIKTDNRAKKLEWATRSENQQHAFDTGLRKRCKGERCCRAKLTDKDVIKIRELHNNGLKTSKLATLYPNISYSQLSRIANKKAWTHI